jgi:signal transduction histidine kinase/ligand-binding sensor domain-containing protein
MWGRSVISVLLVLACVRCVEASQESQSSFGRFSVQRWTREEGLPQNSCKAICMGPDGFLWGASDSQVWQFDGVRFVPGPVISDPISHADRIIRIGFDAARRLVVGRVMGQGLVFDGAWHALPEWDSKRHSLPCDVIVASNRICCLAADVAGWNGADGWRLAVEDPPSTNRPNFRSGSLAEDGSIWVSAESGLFHLKGDVYARVPVPVAVNDFAYEAVHAGKSGDVWAYRNPGDFFWRTNGVWVALPPIPGKFHSRLGIVAMAERGKGELWAGGRQGLYRWDGKAWGVAVTGGGFYPPGINDLIVDAQGCVWAATEGGGLLCFRERKVDILRVPKGPSLQMFTALCETREGMLIAGVAGAGLFKGTLEGGFSPISIPELSPLATVMSIREDGQGGFWVGALGYHLLHVGRQGKALVIYPGPQVPYMDSGVRALLGSRDGRLWVGTQRGVMVYDAEQGLRWPAGQASHLVNALVEWGGSTVWAASKTEGVLAFEWQTLKWISANEGLPDRCVDTLFADRAGNLWCGGAFGLARREADGWRRVGADCLPKGIRVVSILDDEAGYLWLGTDKGILRLNRSDSKTQEPAFDLGREEGLGQEACVGGFSPAGLRLSNGRLLFPTRDGLVVVNPERIGTSRSPVATVIDEVVADGSVCWKRQVLASASDANEAVRLPAGTRRVTVRWLTPAPGAGRTARFNIVLKGGSSLMDATTLLREVSYENLSPGRYVFSLSTDNRTSRETTTPDFPIELLPLWWQRASVKALLGLGCFGIVGGLGWWGARRRAKRLRQSDILRLRIARDLHDEIGSNLGGISLWLDLAGKQAETEAFQQIRKIVGQSVGALKDMVWMIDPVNDNASDLVKRMKEIAELLLPSLPYTFEITGNPQQLRIPTLVRRNVLPVFKETLHNVSKHAQASQVSISLAFQPRRILLRVDDNGVGLPVTPRKGGHGLRNMGRRAEEIGASLKLERRPGGGTRLILDIPLTKDPK